MPKPTVKLILALMYLGAVFFVTGLVFHRFQSFDGVIVVEVGRSESWVASASGSNGTFATAHRNMPAEVVGFDNPAVAVRVLGVEDSYDVVKLPFSLHVRSVEVVEARADKHLIEVRGEGDARLVEAVSGVSLDTSDGPVRVIDVIPWNGLIRDLRGAPMSAVRIKGADALWSPPLFVNLNSENRGFPGVALSFLWFDSEDGAKAAFPESSPAIAARWGVRESGRVHWFDSLTPGAGVTTSDGAEYTLVDVVVSDSGAPELLQVIKRIGNAAERIHVRPNAHGPEDALLFECHDDAIVARIHAWRDGAALVSVYSSGERQGPLRVEEGEEVALEMDGQPWGALRLEQVMSAAVPVSSVDSSVLAVALDTPRGELALREGQALGFGDLRLRYRRVPQTPVVRYQLRALWREKEQSLDFELGEGDARRVDNWRFHQDQENPYAEKVATLRAVRITGTPGRIMGAILFMLGAVGLCILRFADWSARIESARFHDAEWIAVDASAGVLDDDDGGGVESATCRDRRRQE